ncbi:MAG: CPBP family intramembrane metalloprotease [Ruminiclostridium sp.]|nr:CPBP family intramembrane metalloprotease [Ruminiclostridium sp.]
MYENSLDVNIHAEQRQRFRTLSKKYGASMVALTVNPYISSFIFILLAEIVSKIIGINLLEENTDIGYYTTLALNELVAYVFPIIFLSLIFKQNRQLFIPDKTYKPFFGEAFMLFLASLTAGAIGTIVTETINDIIDHFFGTGEIEEAFAGLEPLSMGQFLFFTFCVAVIAPIAEEYMFRDLLLKPLRAFGDTTAVVVTGLLFGLYHGNFDQFAFATLAGMFYSMIAVKYNSIKPTIILHSFNNLIVTISGDLTGAVEGMGEEVKNTCTVISDICASAVGVMMFLGIGASFLLILSGRLKFNNHNIFVPEKEAMKTFFSTPLVIVGLIVMLAVFFIK